MENLFLAILRMSGTAAIVILAVLLARLLLRKAPKIFSYALWAVVLFRLLCPFSIPSGFSLLPVVQTSPAGEELTRVAVYTGISPLNSQVNGYLSEHPYPVEFTQPQSQGGPSDQYLEGVSRMVGTAAPDWTAAACWVWLAGAAVLLGYSLVSLLALRRRLIGSAPLEGEKNVRLADHIPFPFVLGMVRPKIYLPSDLPEHERDYILLHERTHIRRCDHIFRALAWLALALHWFNPLVWLAFHLAGKDMEMSCDEAVLRKMGRDVRADYSSSLLRLSTGKRLPAGPLAFGDGDPQSRIKNVLHYKKPALWVIVIALAAVLCAGVALATNPGAVADSPKPGPFVYHDPGPAELWVDRAAYTFFPVVKETQLPEFPGVTFRWTGDYVMAVTGGGEMTLLGGTPIWNVYLCDLNGDGCRELCATVTGVMDDYRVLVYDYKHRSSLKLQDQGAHDYTLRLEGDQLWAMERDYQGEDVLRAGPLVLTESGLDIQADAPARVSLPEADLTFSLEESESGPIVRMEGSVDGVALRRNAVWWLQGLEALFDGRSGGVSLSWQFANGGAEVNAWWADEGHTAVTLSTKMSAMVSSYVPTGWWEFTVDLLNGTVTEMTACPLWEEGLSGEMRMYPTSIPDEDAVKAARAAARLLTAAEDYYYNAARAEDASGPVYSLVDTGTGVAIYGLDCAGAAWWPRDVTLDSRLGLPEGGALGYLSVENPRFLGGHFANAYGNAIALYYPDEDGPLLAMGFDDYTDSVYEPGSIFFTVDLAAGEVASLEMSGYDHKVDTTEEGLVDMARALAQLIQGAAGSFGPLSNPPAEDGPLPFDQPMRLWFGSGAGAWRTILTLHPDGSFEGTYTDSDMGSGAGDAPMGVQYICTFHGRFGDIRQASAASWAMTLEELTLDTGRPVGEEWIAERRRYISSAPYGLDGADGEALEPGAQFVFYTPDASGKPGGELYGMEDESSGLYEFWTWWPRRSAISEGGGGELGCYALRNVETGHGFFDLRAWGITG